jgi:hypothetical protein
MKEFSTITGSKGIVVCDKEDGAIVVLNCAEDVENLKAVLDTIKITRAGDAKPEPEKSRTFSEWWQANSDEYQKQAAHLSGYSMANVVWIASRESKELTTMDVRPAVRNFAEAMERKLRKTDYKSCWSEETLQALQSKLVYEVSELEDELKADPLSLGMIKGEAVDVANYAMMIFDNTDHMEK